jgi:uncharacterized protein (TIGR02246 family)
MPLYDRTVTWTRNPTPEMVELKSVISALFDTWNRHDMSAFAGLFSRHADFVDVLGMHLRGREEIEERLADAHRTIFRNSTLRPESYGFRGLTPTIALVHLNWQITGADTVPGRDPGEDRHGVMTLLVERSERWLITAAHNTETVPIPVSK